MTVTEVEQEVKKLPLAERADLLSRVQLSEDERDALDDLRDLDDPTVLDALLESREDLRTGRVRAFSDFLAELDAEERATRSS